MTIEKFLAILVKRWWLVLLCSLTVGAGAYIGSRFMTPLYQSTALIQIAIRSSNNQGDYYTSLLASEQLIQTEATLATSDPVLREVASHYPNMTVEQLSREVTAAPKLNTQLFEIDVQNSSPTLAALLANDVAGTLIKQQTQTFRQNAVQSDVYLLIVQPAQPSLSPVRPNKLLNTGAGLLAGFLLGILFAVLLELLDTRVRTPEALTQLLGWSVLATIWRARSKEEVFNPKGNNTNLEAYRILRTNIGFATIDKPVHTLVVTSAMPRDGKSIVAANLAIFMAKAGKNTLLIDADLRHPVQGDLFGIPGDRMGLSNAILAFSIPATASAPADDKLRASATSAPPSSMPPTTQRSLDPFINAVHIPNLYVMPSGSLPPNPSELLDSKALQHLFKGLNSCGVEVVIFDTPPLLGLSDASIMASKVDSTLIVVDITRDRKRSLKQAKALLERAGVCVLGCVVNKLRRSGKDTIYCYYSGTDGQEEGEDLDVEHAGSLPALSLGPDDITKLGAASQLALIDQNEEEHHSTHNVNSLAIPANAFEANDQSIRLSQVNRRKDEQCEDR
jgi:Mrp family chromosome partitioning ATPase/capsular polysaccharide biosynthesis protein